MVHYLVGIHRPDVGEPHGDSDVLPGVDGARLQGERRVAERAVRETVAEREERVPVVVVVRVAVHRVVCDGRNLWKKDTFNGMFTLNSIKSESEIKCYEISRMFNNDVNCGDKEVSKKVTKDFFFDFCMNYIWACVEDSNNTIFRRSMRTFSSKGSRN